MLLAIDNLCSQSSMLTIIWIIKRVLNVIKVMVPILLVVMGILDFSKAVIASDESKMKIAGSNFIKRAMYAAIIFFIPAIVDFTFRTLDQGNVFEEACWSSATEENIEKFKQKEQELLEQQLLAEKKAAEEAAAKKKAEAEKNNNNGVQSGANTSPRPNTSTLSNADKLRNEVVEYALRFLGRPYVWGGTDLNSGVDCSGFTMRVYENFGIQIPRVSRDQAEASNGDIITPMTAENLKKGDLIFYAPNGTVNHVAMYIGEGQIIHAAGRATGIILSSYNYKAPFRVRRFIKD